MLKSLSVKRFKSLSAVKLELAPLTVFFGPNAAGKSNLLDAILVLSRLATERTLAEALEGPVRGLPLELFAFPEDGLPGLLQKRDVSFEVGGELRASADENFRYQVEVSINPRSGTLGLRDELLQPLRPKGTPRGNAVIERDESGAKLRVRKRGAAAHPFEEKLPLHHTVVSNARYSGDAYAAIERARQELSSFRAYYLDPRVAMRTSQAPREVQDVGPLGEHIAPFLYRLRAEHPKVFEAVRRTLRTIIPSVEELSVDLDAKRGVLDVEIRQDGTPYSSRIVSEGTLRVLALLCMALNPWGGSLVAFEEPENGVHPRRIELIAEVLAALVLEDEPRRQVILTSHSPVFCAAMLRRAKVHPDRISLYRVFREARETRCERFEPSGPLFEDAEIQNSLTIPDEERVFENLLLRGVLDG